MPATDFRVMPPLRCGHATGNPSQPFCGELAYWQRSTAGGVLAAVFCGRHRQPDDEPIAGAQLVRRVSFHLDVLFHGLGLSPAESHAEALGRLETAVLGIGGLPNLHSVTSETGRFTRPAGPERRKP